MADQRIARRQAVFGLLMALFYSAVMSGAFALMAHGLHREALTAWVRGWGVGFMIAVPIGFLLRPFAGKLAWLFVTDRGSRH
jgi:uncharacterized membrane protein YjjP (DUF1212 family)